MTTLSDLLATLSARGVTLSAQGDRLHVEGPVGAITPELRAQLVAHKADLLAYLAEPQLVRIPLEGLAEYLAANGLQVVGGTPTYGGEKFRPVLFLAQREVHA